MQKIPQILFITQKIHQNDDDLAFVILWIKEMIKQGAKVKVICLQRGDFDDSFEVYSLGKEKGAGRIQRIFTFFKLIFTLKYNRVFVHMNPEYVSLGGWYWWLRRKPIYLWYTHYTMHLHLWLSGFLSKRMFAATSQSLPQYDDNPKKVITGHGIDMSFWLKDSEEKRQQPKQILTVHRICRSKRLELSIKALKYLPQDFTLKVYGRDVEKDYYLEIKELIVKENLENRVSLMGPMPMPELKKIYPNYSLMFNMAMETIDKTMLEGMLFGIYPITTPNNSQAIGLPVWPKGESARDIADFVLAGEYKKYSRDYLRGIVEQKHSLPFLINKMLKYITLGN